MEHLEENKKKVFTVPDGYFEQLNRNIMNATAGKGATTTQHKRFVLGKFARIAGYAACFVIFLGIAAAVFTPEKKEDGTMTTIATNENGDSENEYIDNVFNSYAIDDYTFYCYLTDIDFE